MELIDKLKLLEELKKCEKICDNYISLHKDAVSQGIANAKRAMCQHIIKIINTLELKKVDVEKEINEYMKLHHLHIKDGGRIIFENGDTPNFMCDFHDIAKHFFELGIKSKGE